jgi:ribokinase
MATASVFVLGSFVISCSAKVARFPQAGESLRAQRVAVEPGGKGFNLALGAARLGIAVEGLLAVGNDFLSGFAEPALRSANLPATMLTRFSGTTGSGIGFTDATGENCVAVDPGANLSLSAENVRAVRDRVNQADLVLAQFEIDDAPILEAFSLARAAGRRTLLNPSPFRELPPAMLADTSILIVNAAEAAALALSIAPDLAFAAGPDGLATAERLAQALFRLGPDTLILTLGAQGAIALRAGLPTLRQLAFPVAAVDTLGAGDAFAAGLAASLVEGRNFDEALRRAAGCGALATLRMGVFDALPSAVELDRFLLSQP